MEDSRTNSLDPSGEILNTSRSEVELIYGIEEVVELKDLSGSDRYEESSQINV